MFERFTDPITIVRMIQQGDLSRLRKVISAGAKIDRRTSGEPWMTPLDAAASSQDTQAVALLLAAGAPIYGSSIYDAIAKDAVRVLQSFHSHDPSRLLKYSPASKSILPRSIVRAGLFSYPGITAPDPAYSGLI